MRRHPKRTISPVIAGPVIVWLAILVATIVFRLIEWDRPTRWVTPMGLAIIAVVTLTIGLARHSYLLIAFGLVVSAGSPTVLVWYAWPLLLLLALAAVVIAAREQLRSRPTSVRTRT